MGRDAFSRILDRYGRTVRLYFGEEEQGQLTRAFLQPLPQKRDGGRQYVPTSLGLVQEESFLYLGGAEVDVSKALYLSCEGQDYEIRFAQLVYRGREKSHWRGILTVREEAVL